MERKLVKRQLSRIGLAFFSYTVSATVGQIIITVILAAGVMMKLLPPVIVGQDALMLESQLCMMCVSLPLYYCIMSGIPVSDWSKTRKNLTIGQFFSAFVVSVGAAYIGNFLAVKLLTQLKSALGIKGILSLPGNLMQELDPVTVFIAAVILAPIVEELVFRKILIDRIMLFGQRAAVLFSGVSFGLMHGNIQQFVYTFLLGMVFAYVYSSTGRIRYTILLHMMINMIGTLYSYLLKQNIETSEIQLVQNSFHVLIVLSIIFVIVMAWWMKDRIAWFPAQNGCPEEKTFYGLALTAPGILLYIALSFVSMGVFFVMGI